jgi:hypothetical protein
VSVFTKKGEDAVNSATTNEGGGGDSPIVSFKSGLVYKVGVKSINDVAEYYGHSIYKKVNTFVPKVSVERNAKGYVTANPSIWDRAADVLYTDAKAAKDSGASEADVKLITDEAYLFRAKPRFLRAFYDLTTGKDIVVDLSPTQEKTLKSTIADNIDDLDSIAFKLAKKGDGTAAVVSLSAIVKMDRDLTAEERANFANLSAAKFDMESLESCLYLADEAEQTKSLVIAGFDIGRLGLSIGASAPSDGNKADDSTPIDPNASIDISDDDLPF